jgi:hypothetical protein
MVFAGIRTGLTRGGVAGCVDGLAALDQRSLPALEINSTADRFEPMQQPSPSIAPYTSERNQRSWAQGWSDR